MDIFVPGLRDRRVPSSNEKHSNIGKDLFEKGEAGEDPWWRENKSGLNLSINNSNRSWSEINAIVLQHRSEPQPDSLTQEPTAHFVVGANGEIIYSKDIEQTIQKSNGKLAIYIEFECAGSKKRNAQAPRLSRDAIFAGRRLVSFLTESLPNIQQIYQLENTQEDNTAEPRKRSASPDIWINIGTWATSRLGLKCRRQSPRTTSEQSSVSYTPPQLSGLLV